jgi:hypothetical protein
MIGAHEKVEQLCKSRPVAAQLKGEQLALDRHEIQQVGEPVEVLLLGGNEPRCLGLSRLAPCPHGSFACASLRLDEREHDHALQVEAREQAAGVVAELTLQVLERGQQLLGDRT